MKHVHFPDVEGLDSLSIGLEGSARMRVKPGSQNSVCIEFAPGGHSPDHAHEDKERLVVISGSGEIVVDDGPRRIRPGDFIEFGSAERHQIVNSGDEPLVVMCFRNQT